MPDADVIVVGGGAAGVAAAVGAARCGAETVLIERGPCLGGAATLRNVSAYGGLFAEPDRQVVFGVADEVLAGLRDLGAAGPPTWVDPGVTALVFEPEPLKVVLDRVCRHAGVRVLLHSYVVGAVRDRGGRLAHVEIADHGGRRTLRATAWVDASGEADLAARAGAAVRYGNGGRVQNGTLGVRFGGIAEDVDLSREALVAAIRDAKSAGLLPETAAETGFVTRLPQSQHVLTYLVDAGYDARDAEATSIAEARARETALGYLAMFRSLPGCAGAWVDSTGPELGTRESRHVIAPRQLTEEQVVDPAPPADDTVAIGSWPVEYHSAPGVPSEWRMVGGQGIFGIPLDVLRSVDTANLLAAGRAVDGDRGAGASIRVMGTAFGTGHAAGVAASHLARTGAAPVQEVRRSLEDQRAWLGTGEPLATSMATRR